MAASADVLTEFSEIALCSICTEVYTHPRLLECRHTFCLQCLEQYAEDKEYGENVSCPVCRQSTDIPHGGMVNLERNRDMERLVETAHRVESQLKEVRCDCDKHLGKAVMLYCKTCSCLVCSSCIVGDHAGHQYQEVDGAAEELVTQLESKLGDSVSNCVRNLCAKRAQIDRANEKIQGIAAVTRRNIESHHKDIVAMLRKDCDHLYSEVNAAINESRELKDQAYNFFLKLNFFQNLMDSKTVRPASVIIHCTKLLQLPIEDVLSHDTDKMILHFEPNLKLFKLENKAVSLLGSVSYAKSAMKQGQKSKGRQTGNEMNVMSRVQSVFLWYFL